MQESHGKGPASHPDPESCVDGRKAGGEALTGAHAGQPLSCEIRQSGVPTPLSEAEGHTGIDATGKSRATRTGWGTSRAKARRWSAGSWPRQADAVGISRFPCKEFPRMRRVFDCAGSMIGTA
jgi:hypothetical protein